MVEEEKVERGYASECRRICPFVFIPFELGSSMLYTLSDVVACQKSPPPIPPEKIPPERVREVKRAVREVEMTEEEKRVVARAEEEYKKKMVEMFPNKLEVTDILIKDSKRHAVNGMGRLTVGSPFTVDTIVANRSTEATDANVFLALNDEKIAGTDRTVHIFGELAVTTAGMAEFDKWTVTVTSPNEPEGYKLCVVARPIKAGMAAGKGCREIHVL